MIDKSIVPAIGAKYGKQISELYESISDAQQQMNTEIENAVRLCQESGHKDNGAMFYGSCVYCGELLG